jgi:regulator of protease activity HflC (stomatin/prohibitin superfamily)
VSNQNFANRGRPNARLWVILAAVIVIGVLLSSTFVFLQANEYGVVISPLSPNGYRAQTLGPGLHLIIPLIESVKKYSVASQTYTMSSTSSEGAVQGDDSIQARTKDGQQIFIDASVIYAIDPNQLIPLHIKWQNRYEEMVVRPVARAAIRDAVSQFGVEEIVSTKRAELEAAISDEIKTSFARNYIIMTDFLLRNIRFSDEYAKAVEQKQIAEQQAQQAKFVVEQRKQEAEQARQVAQGQADAAVIAAKGAAQARLIQAEAEAKANDLIAASLAGRPELLTWLYITKLAPNIQVMLLPANAPFLFPLPDLVTQ